MYIEQIDPKDYEVPSDHKWGVFNEEDDMVDSFPTHHEARYCLYKAGCCLTCGEKLAAGKCACKEIQ